MQGSFAPEKNGTLRPNGQERQRTKWRVAAGGMALPVGGTLTSASPAEVTMAISTLTDYKAGTGRFQRRLIVDQAHDAGSMRH